MNGKDDVEKSLFHFLFFFWTVWLQQNPAWFLGVCVFFYVVDWDFWEMVHEEQTHPANQVNVHMVHPSLFTCFDLTFKGQRFLLSKGRQWKTITPSLSVSERQKFSCAGWSGADSCIFFFLQFFFFLKQLFFFFLHEGLPQAIQFKSHSRARIPFSFPRLRRRDTSERDGKILHGEEQPPVRSGQTGRQRGLHL